MEIVDPESMMSCLYVRSELEYNAPGRAVPCGSRAVVLEDNVRVGPVRVLLHGSGVHGWVERTWLEAV